MPLVKPSKPHGNSLTEGKSFAKRTGVYRAKLEQTQILSSWCIASPRSVPE